MVHIPAWSIPPSPGTSNNVVRRWKLRRQTEVAKSEIHKRTLNIFSNLWWKYMPGTIIEVKWPVGWIILHDNGNGDQTSTESADPNDHYRQDLEKFVGKQGRDWEWRIGSVARDKNNYDTLLIKMRKGKDDYASIAKLKWM